MIRKWLLICAIALSVINTCIAQDTFSKKLIGVWEYKRPDSKVCMVFIDQNSGALTNEFGFIYFMFSYQIVSDEGVNLFIQHVPVYNNENDTNKFLLQLSNDTTFLLNDKVKGKSARLMEGKGVITYKKRIELNAENFIRKPDQKDLIGSWLRIIKKDTSLLFNFKKDNSLEMKDYHTGKQISGRYIFKSDIEPMTLDIINDKGGIIPTICMFDGYDNLRMAGPKNGKRRTRFTMFGDNSYLKRGLNMQTNQRVKQ